MACNRETTSQPQAQIFDHDGYPRSAVLDKHTFRANPSVYGLSDMASDILSMLRYNSHSIDIESPAACSLLRARRSPGLEIGGFKFMKLPLRLQHQLQCVLAIPAHSNCGDAYSTSSGSSPKATASEDHKSHCECETKTIHEERSEMLSIAALHIAGTFLGLFTASRAHLGLAWNARGLYDWVHGHVQSLFGIRFEMCASTQLFQSGTRTSLNGGRLHAALTSPA
jgi:hypothetical protein